MAPLTEYVRAFIERSVRAGYLDPSEIVEAVFDVIEPEDARRLAEDLPEIVRAHVRRAEVRLAEEATAWPETTDCDRLERAFATLRQRGVLLLEDCGLTMSELSYEAGARAEDGFVGWVGFHGQDTERAVDGGGLHLAFESAEGDTAGFGAQVVDALRDAGLSVEWDGSADRRILVTPLRWQRRVGALRASAADWVPRVSGVRPVSGAVADEPPVPQLARTDWDAFERSLAAALERLWAFDPRPFLVIADERTGRYAQVSLGDPAVLEVSGDAYLAEPHRVGAAGADALAALGLIREHDAPNPAMYWSRGDEPRVAATMRRALEGVLAADLARLDVTTGA